MRKEQLKTWIELDRSALKNNYSEMRRIVGPECRLLAVVKSNAYGHGLLDFSSALEKMGVDWFGVDSVVEAEHLRDAGIKKPILVLGYTIKDSFKTAADRNISITIADFQSLKDLNSYKNKNGKLPKVHLKIDSGMHRQGFFIPEVPRVIKFLKSNLPTLDIEGVYTHFSSAKNPAFPQETISQMNYFEEAVRIIQAAGFKPVRHAAATSGTLVFPKSRLDMARVGIGFYGLWPSHETKMAFRDKIKLRPVLTWKTIVSQLRVLPKGSRVGYDLTEELNRKSKVAVLPIGYWHGYPRALSSIGNVLIRDKTAKVLGRICMDVLMVDVTDIKGVRIGDEAVLLGKSGKSEVSADDLALLCGTTSYEIITRINPLIKRVFK